MMMPPVLCLCLCVCVHGKVFHQLVHVELVYSAKGSSNMTLSVVYLFTYMYRTYIYLFKLCIVHTTIQCTNMNLCTLCTQTRRDIHQSCAVTKRIFHMYER